MKKIYKRRDENRDSLRMCKLPDKTWTSYVTMEDSKLFFSYFDSCNRDKEYVLIENLNIRMQTKASVKFYNKNLK